MPELSQRALERRLKRQLLKASQRYFAVCAPGFEDVLLREVQALPGVTDAAPDTGGVEFDGPLELVYHANLRLRSAHRVLLRLDEFLAQNYPTLFDRVRRLPWELYLGSSPSYRLHVSARTSRLRQHKNIAKTVRDGVRARLDPLGLRPVLGEEGLELHVRFHRDRCTLSLDTSGEHLHRRGYRLLTSEAPLRETLAASVLLASDWAAHDLILDPMCGSGTLLIEAALLATNTAPGLRRSFAFEQAPFFQPSKWARLQGEARKVIQPSRLRLLGNDLDAGVLELARTSAARAGVAASIGFTRQDALTFSPASSARNPLLASNLPYGQRLGTPEATRELLHAFARQLKKTYAGWSYAFVATDGAWLEQAGIERSETRAFRNGGLPVLLLRGRI